MRLNKQYRISWRRVFSYMLIKYIRIIFLALMLACIIYTVIIYNVGSGTFSFIIWLVGAAFFGAAYFFAGNGRWQRVPIALRGTMYGIIILAIIVMMICMGAMLKHFKDKGDPGLDYIVVLGAQMRNNDPSVVFKYRLDAAYEYLVENPETICIVSGGKGRNETVSEGDGGKQYLVSKGIASERIIAETQAMDTVENVVNSFEIINRSVNADEIKIGIVTNNYHVFHGVHLAMNLTSNDVCGIAAYTIPLYLPNNMVRECFGILRDFTKMKFNSVGEIPHL